MKFSDVIGKIGTPVNRDEAVAAIRAEHGKGARAWLADKFGVTRDTAGRWLSGKQSPSKASGGTSALNGSASKNHVAAQALRGAQIVDVGKAKVKVISPGTSEERNIGSLNVSPEMQAKLEAAADLMETGDTAGAEALIKEAVLEEYGAQRGGNRGAISSIMDLEEFGGGFNIY
jgi:hypothetical protein